jgi:hypothetical protein
VNTTTLANGTYSYTRPTMGPSDITVTARILGGQLVEGTYDGKPMTGSCWRACTLADLNTLPFTFTAPIGKARAFKFHRALAAAGYRSEHYALASGVLGREVRHLRDLTEAEARQVWAALTHSVAA